MFVKTLIENNFPMILRVKRASNVFLLVSLLSLLSCGEGQQQEEKSAEVTFQINYNSPTNRSSHAWYGTPTNPSDFNCFAVYADLGTTSSASYCYSTSNVSIFNGHQGAGWGSSGAALSMNVPVQTVTFHLLGIKVANASSCPSTLAATDDSTAGLSRPRWLGQSTVSLAQGANTVSLNGSLSASRPIGGCTGSAFPFTISNTFCSDFEGALTYNEAGSGTSADPYMICTAAQLNDIGSSACNASTTTGCGSYYQLGANIDLSSLGTSFVPIGGNASSQAFYGSFDGDGYTISNLSLSSSSLDGLGLFRVLGNNGTTSAAVSDLVLSSPSITQSSNSLTAAGALVGTVTGLIADPVDISGVTVTSASVTGYAKIGAIVGEADYIDLSSVAASGQVVLVPGATYQIAGGLVGASGDHTGNIDQVLYTGSVSTSTAATNANPLLIGGIIGLLSGGYLSESKFTGTIPASHSPSGAIAGYIGGIAGKLQMSSGTTIILQDTISSGTLSVTIGNTDAVPKVGGIVGNASVSSGQSLTIKNSYFNGTMSITGTTPTSGFAGGLLGYCDYSAGTLNYYYAFSAGTINASNLSSTYTGNVTGAVASCTPSSLVYLLSQSCTSSGGAGSCNTASATSASSNALMPAASTASVPFGDGSTIQWNGSNTAWLFSSSSYPTLLNLPSL